MDDVILQEQLAYYRARAATYEASLGDSLQGPLTAVGALLSQLGPFGPALELACGTGIWTRRLLTVAAQVTAVDGAPEMLAHHAAQVADPRVRYQCADLFTWEPDQEYDLVFFAFWLSHVPPARLGAWLATVRRAVRPGGILIIVDEHTPTAEDRAIALADIYARRPLEDGRTFTIVKVFYDLAEIQTRLAAQGLEVVTAPLDARFFVLSGRVGTAGRAVATAAPT